MNLRLEREKKGWSQQYVADRAGVTPETIHYIETAQRKPSYDVLVKLEDLFKKSHRTLFAVADETDQSQEDSTTKNGGIKDAGEINDRRNSSVE